MSKYSYTYKDIHGDSHIYLGRVWATSLNLGGSGSIPINIGSLVGTGSSSGNVNENFCRSNEVFKIIKLRYVQKRGLLIIIIFIIQLDIVY